MNRAMLAEEIVKEAHRWAKIKVPYRHRGVSENGCDCAGLIVGILKKLGFLQSYNLPPYPRGWDKLRESNYLIEEISKFGHEIMKQDTQSGDILLFCFNRKMMHAAVCIGNAMFVHCYQRCAVKIDTVMTSEWTPRWATTYRLDPEKL